MKHIMILIVLASLAVAQAPKFVDNSPTGSPVSLAGSKDAQSRECTIKVHDKDQRPIVAVVVQFDAQHNADQIMSHDHFFRSDDHVAMHGTDFEMLIMCDQPTVTMTTKVVQFNDGQLWSGSDPKAVEALAESRREVIDYLGELLAAPDIKEALATVQKGHWNTDHAFITGRVAERSGLMLEKDPTATAKDRLANATAHADWLLNLK